MESKKARKNIADLFHGKPVKTAFSLAEAKERLRANDPGLNIRLPLEAVSNGDHQKAFNSLLAESVSAVSLSYIKPLLSVAIRQLFSISSKP